MRRPVVAIGLGQLEEIAQHNVAKAIAKPIGIGLQFPLRQDPLSA